MSRPLKRDITLSIGQIRKWAVGIPHLTGGYSSTHNLVRVGAAVRSVDLPAGGWTLNTEDDLVINYRLLKVAE